VTGLAACLVCVGTFELPMSKQKTLATAPAKIARRLSYFIDVIGRSGFQGGYQWAFRQLDGSWKIWRSGVGEASEPTMTPTRSSIGSRSNCNAAPSTDMAVPPRPADQRRDR
jgi:hypothetical protein